MIQNLKTLSNVITNIASKQIRELIFIVYSRIDSTSPADMYAIVRCFPVDVVAMRARGTNLLVFAPCVQDSVTIAPFQNLELLGVVFIQKK